MKISKNRGKGVENEKILWKTRTLLSDWLGINRSGLRFGGKRSTLQEFSTPSVAFAALLCMNLWLPDPEGTTAFRPKRNDSN